MARNDVNSDDVARAILRLLTANQPKRGRTATPSRVEATILSGGGGGGGGGGAATGKYRQYLVVPDGGGGFAMLDDGFGSPVESLEDLE